jgi:hypothetical protein
MSQQPATSKKRPPGAHHHRNRGGAPKGNLNALKHGRRSPRVQATQAALDAIQRNAPGIARLAASGRRRREVMAHTFRLLADLLLAQPGIQTTQEIPPALILKAARRAKKSAQTNGQPRNTVGTLCHPEGRGGEARGGEPEGSVPPSAHPSPDP